MNEKLYIRKEKVDIRILLFAICMLVMWNVSSYFRYRQSWISTDARIISSVIFLVFFYCFMFFRNRRKNDIIKNGEVVWCKVDRSRCNHNVSGIVIRGGYFWKDTKMFMEYTGSVRTALDSRRDEYAEIMERVKYVPVFVDVLDRNKYAMVLCDFWVKPEELDAKSKDVIRVIDNRLYKKEDC